MRKPLLPSALAVAMFAVSVFSSGAAIAGNTASTELAVTVDQICNFSTDYATLSANLTDSGDVGFEGQIDAASGFDVMCNAGTAYTIEADVAAGGLAMLTGDTTANVVPAYLWQGAGMPFSTVANGEAITGIATGGFDRHDFQVSFNTAADGTSPLALPVADTYRRTVNFNLTY